ncbi:synaptotagmin-like protein 2 isoform X2 [Anabas testudineus]|uniref:Synaptotagmin-like protein 2 n=1 Tax=Anabas testudineus TaxID=64144 RepID=A0A3Q1K845_ANATE|nr:synaptotagmin-like protein 2 isoform X2 [Anabas testudineus]
MIDLSHLTEEEQGAIMTVLRRDLELKKFEGERVRKLEKIVSGGSRSDAKLKYLTGEWFYEAKSRRHTDTIHGSEIILASMKQRKAAGLDGSLRIERSKTPSSRASDTGAPPKPARCLEAPLPQQINDAENPGVRSPRPRHNPFNRASLIVVEPPENNNDQESPKTELLLPLKNHPAGEPSQTSGGSVTSESSSTGLRPVPKKRTFPPKPTSIQSKSNDQGLEARVGSEAIVPAPRRSLQQGSSGSSNQSFTKTRDETPPKVAAPESKQVYQSTRPSSSADETPKQPLCAVSQVSSNSSLERERKSPCTTRDRPSTYRSGDVFTEKQTPQKRRGDDQTQRGPVGVNTVILPTSIIQGSDRENSSSLVTATGQEELSFSQSTVDPDPPVSYDLNFIDKSDQQMQQKSNQKHAFKLSTQATSPTGDEEDSIAKVLDWFSRSSDSSDWLNEKGGSEAIKSSDTHVEINKLKREDSLGKDGDIISDRQQESLEMKRSHLQRQANEANEFKTTDTMGNNEQTETEEVVLKDVGERMRSEEVKDNGDEWQPPKISHLKSFWEKSNTGPKILISKSITPSNTEQKPVHLPEEKDKENVNKQHRVSGIYTAKGISDEDASNRANEREQLVMCPETDMGDGVHVNINQKEDHLWMNASTQRDNYDPTHNLQLPSSAQEVDRGGSDTKVECLTQPRTSIQPRVSPESQSLSSVKPNQQPHSISQFQDTLQQEYLPGTMTAPQLDIDLQTMDGPVSENIDLPRTSPYVDYEQGGNDVQITPKAQVCRSSSEDWKRWDSEDKGPHSNSQDLPQESTAERIKQLRSFWEQERNKPMFYTGKPKPLGNGKVARGAGNQSNLNKRFTKSEYDLRSVGNDSDSDPEDSNRSQHNFTILPLNQRIENVSPSLSMSRTHFNTLREFWDEAASDTKASPSFGKPKTPKRKEPTSAQTPCQELKCGSPEVYCVSSAVNKTRPAATKSSPPPQSRSKSPHDRQTGSGSRAASDSKNSQSSYTTTESKRSSRDSSREEKPTKSQISSGKETRSPKGRKDSFGNSSGRSSLRRATSMFALSAPDEKDHRQLQTDVSPVQSQSRKERQNTDKGVVLRRPSEESETLTPRARAFVPRDYRHYLGMTDKNTVHASLAPAVKDEGSEAKSGYEFDLSSPVRASTPVSSEERYSRKSNKASQRPLWANYSSSDTGQESSMSSTSESWSISRNSSNRENDNENHNPVRKALRRAEARPKNLAKSMEDITAPLSPRQERRQEPTADLRRVSDVSSIPSPFSSLILDPDHQKKMSKSVPSFLQNEDAGRDTDSSFEDRRGKLMLGRSMTNLTNSSGMASVSSLSGSVMTMYSGDFGNIEVQGNIQFSINYIQRLREFHIFVAECRDLAAVDPKRGRSDPYVKSYLFPDKANLGKRKTSVKKKTLNPTFNEILRYRVRMEYLRTQTLILSVWHHDTFGRNSFLGEVDVDLSNWDFDHTQMNYLALKPRNIPTVVTSNDRGEMKLAIRFLPQITSSEGVTKDVPTFGEIHIWVKECKNLPLIRTTIDPYVKCFVLPDTSRKSRQKTRVLRRTVDPVFNHTMVYDGIREVDLTEACVELTVWDRDRLANNLLGGLRLGAGTGRSYGAVVDWMDSNSYEVALWERMMSSPNEWVEGMLPLRMLTSAKTALK